MAKKAKSGAKSSNAPAASDQRAAEIAPRAKKSLDLHELASSILAEAIMPTIEQIKELAQAVIGAKKPGTAKKDKAAKTAKPKSAKVEKTADKAKKKAGKDDAGKKRKARLKGADPKPPKVKLPKPKKAKA